MVTRTVHGMEVSIKVVDTSTEQIIEDTVTLSKSYDDDAKLKKAVAKAIPENQILVAITGTKQVEKCYGIPVTDFMAQAIEIDPKTRAAFERPVNGEENG